MIIAHYYYYYFYFFDPGTQFQGNEKNYAMQYKKKYKNQAGISLRPLLLLLIYYDTRTVKRKVTVVYINTQVTAYIRYLNR